MSGGDKKAKPAAAKGNNKIAPQKADGKRTGKSTKEVEPAAPPKEIERDGVKLTVPLEINTRILCRWNMSDSREFRPARVVERRKKIDPPAKDDWDYEYYMHFIGFNRRMDEWHDLEDMDPREMETDAEYEAEGGPKSLGQKRKWEDMELHEDHDGFDPVQLREHEEFTKVKNVDKIELGRYEMTTWYFSPLPMEFHGLKKLYFCEYDLAFFKTRDQLLRHLRKCEMKHPPGDEIYRNGNVSMFELDGKKERMYCQNLCYLAKLFLDHKTLYYDVDLFLFYVLCECDEHGAHIVGYFSKEKASEEGHNLACILTLPAYQRKGYGKFLISFSYELSKIEGRVGTPERPLSDLGYVSYMSYWTRVILNILKDTEEEVSIQDLVQMTMIRQEDIIRTLQELDMIQYSKGQHVIFASQEKIESALKKAGSEGLPVDPKRIIWTPYSADKDSAIFKP